MSNPYVLRSVLYRGGFTDQHSYRIEWTDADGNLTCRAFAQWTGPGGAKKHCARLRSYGYRYALRTMKKETPCST